MSHYSESVINPDMEQCQESDQRLARQGSWMVVRVIVRLGSAAGEAERRENDSAGEREIEISQRETEN